MEIMVFSQRNVKREFKWTTQTPKIKFLTTYHIKSNNSNCSFGHI